MSGRAVAKLTAGWGETDEDGFGAWRDAVSPLFEVSGNGRGPDPAREGRLSLWSMGDTVLGACESAGHRFHRRSEIIARGGLDHILVQLLIEGEDVVLSGAAESDCRPGDIRIADLTRPLETATGPYRNLTLVVARELVAPSAAVEDRLHGMILRREQAGARLLAEHMRGVLAAADDLSPAAAAAIAPASVGLVTACLTASGLPPVANDLAGPGRLAGLRSYIDRRLGAPELSLEHLCQRFGLSRSTVYRLFEPHGGVAGYIRRLRLQRAYRRLSEPAGRSTTISSIAVDCGFASLASFSRTFSEAYGLSPRAVQAGDRAPRGLVGETFQAWLAGD